MTLQIDDANQTLTQEIVLLVQLLDMISLPHPYQLLLLWNAVATIALHQNALHLHHVLLNDVEVVFQLRVRTRIPFRKLTSLSPTHMHSGGHVRYDFIRKIRSEDVHLALVFELDATVAQRTI